MGNTRVFIDFGSTFTKAVALDLDDLTLTARVQSTSTVDTDITEGLNSALDMLREAGVPDSSFSGAIATSSAAGGLRMVCIGLVPDYTTKAGHLAALGAGAKVVGTYSYELSGSEIREVAAQKPDIVLLTGGTDGGNKKIIIRNAELLAGIPDSIGTVIVAGNKSAHDDIREIFDGAGVRASYAPNVMPEFGRLELDPVNELIRELFISRIMEAKGITRATGIIREIAMPTPSAVLEAAKLLSAGAGDEPGLGELLLVDVGGATTDVYSIATGVPTRDGVHTLGLREPYAKRTVEGDLGLYHNLDSLATIAEKSEPDAQGDVKAFEQSVNELRAVLSIPGGDAQSRYQLMLSRLAVKTAAERHAGRVEPVPTHDGDIWVQRGKDLSNVGIVIGAGGPLAFSKDARHVLEGAVADPAEPYILKPRAPEFLLDERYILFAIGLLAQSEPERALKIAKKYLKRL